MAKTRKEKEKVVQDLVDRFSRMKSLILVDYTGLNVKMVEELRKELREEEIEYLVVKKTLLKLALKKADLKEINVDQLQGQIALAFGFKDEVMPAKLLDKFRKQSESLKFLGGILEGKFIDDKKVLELAQIPTREELLTKTVWVIQSPVSGLVNVLAGGIRNFVYALKAIQDQKS